MNHKSGYVAILGLPNAGKSSLLNNMLGQKLAITNLKPQTTRKKNVGILSEKDYQIIFLDTPGLLTPSYLLQEKMMEEVARSIIDADVVARKAFKACIRGDAIVVPGIRNLIASILSRATPKWLVRRVLGIVGRATLPRE